MSGRFAYDRAPQRVYWETTRACDLACRHCRAEAAPEPDPAELTTAEGLRLLDDLARFGAPTPHVVLTGGDPLKRPDLFALIAHARAAGLAVSVAPSGTPLLTEAAIRRLKAAGVEAISLSLDGASAARHDALRGVEGCFLRTLAAAVAARAVELPFQVNTLVSEETLGDLPAIHTGEINPSGFLPVSVGNVRTSDVVTVYRESPVFERLRRPELFGGRCGVCEFHGHCGGSRARAYAATGDFAGEDPLCPYEPRPRPAESAADFCAGMGNFPRRAPGAS